MVLRPAEIAVIILTFSEYSIQPFHNLLGLEVMDETDRKNIVKLVALLALGEWEARVDFAFHLLICCHFRPYNLHQSRKRRALR